MGTKSEEQLPSPMPCQFNTSASTQRENVLRPQGQRQDSLTIVQHDPPCTMAGYLDDCDPQLSPMGWLDPRPVLAVQEATAPPAGPMMSLGIKASWFSRQRDPQGVCVEPFVSCSFGHATRLREARLQLASEPSCSTRRRRDEGWPRCGPC